MRIAFVVMTLLAAAALTFSAGADFTRYEKVLVNMKRAGVPPAWLMPLGGAKALGALGLIVGLAVPAVGIAAAVGVILFFVGAFITHVRARWYSFTFPSVYLGLAVSSLTLGLASR